LANVLSYRRVSTQKQVDEGEGLDIQLERIESFCNDNGYILKDGFSDEGVSGAKETIDRPGMMELISYCKAHCDDIDYVVIDKVDRLSRELYEQLFIEKELLVYGIRILYSDQESLNGDNIMIDAMRQMMGVFAELERKMINQRLVDGMRKKASKGNKPVGRQPFGYEFAYDRKATVVNEAEASVVRMIYDLRCKNYTLGQISGYLNEMITEEQRRLFSLSNRRRKWSNQSVLVVLTNEYYIGTLTHDGNKITGNHKPIVDAATWRRVNLMRKKTS